MSGFHFVTPLTFLLFIIARKEDTKKHFTMKLPNHPETDHMIRKIAIFVKSRFIAGVLFLTPLAITVWILYKIFVLTDHPTKFLLQKIVGIFIPGFEGIIVPGIGLITTILIIVLAGILAKNVFGVFLLRLSLSLIEAIPFGRKIYATINEITHSIVGKNKKTTQRAVLVEYPKKDSWVIAFQTAETQKYLNTQISENGEKFVNLFVPTTPNPTSGFMIMVPVSSIRNPDITAEEAVKIIMSGGALDPRSLMDGN